MVGRNDKRKKRSSPFLRWRHDKTAPEDPNSIKIQISTRNLSLGSNHSRLFGGTAEHLVMEVV